MNDWPVINEETGGQIAVSMMVLMIVTTYFDDAQSIRTPSFCRKTLLVPLLRSALLFSAVDEEQAVHVDQLGRGNTSPDSDAVILDLTE